MTPSARSYQRLDARRRGRSPRLRCKPGYVQRGAVCQPKRSSRGGTTDLNAEGGHFRRALPYAAAGVAGIGVIGGGSYLYNQHRKKQEQQKMQQEQTEQSSNSTTTTERQKAKKRATSATKKKSSSSQKQKKRTTQKSPTKSFRISPDDPMVERLRQVANQSQVSTRAKRMAGALRDQIRDRLKTGRRSENRPGGDTDFESRSSYSEASRRRGRRRVVIGSVRDGGNR